MLLVKIGNSYVVDKFIRQCLDIFMWIIYNFIVNVCCRGFIVWFVGIFVIFIGDFFGGDDHGGYALEVSAILLISSQI